uniref:Ubiquitin-like-conjugating enzyme ATG10 n=1 Tax=Cacopsylla melanoneura TaxID=428564 RepID=A0A8D8ZBX6_9HEMI
MSMTYAEFEVYSKRLMEISDNLRDGWTEKICPQNKTVYLVKTQRDVFDRQDLMSDVIGGENLIKTTYYGNREENANPEQQASGSFHICWKLPRTNSIKTTEGGGVKRKHHLVTQQSSTCISFGSDCWDKATVETFSTDCNEIDPVPPKRRKMIETIASSCSRPLTVDKIFEVEILPRNEKEFRKDFAKDTENDSLFTTDTSRTMPMESNKSIVREPDEVNMRETPSPGLMDVEIDLEDDLASYDPRHGDQSSPYTWEYHILYSASYGVPVLYFNVWNTSGALLRLDQVWRVLDFNVENKWGALTQVEHPVLRKPFFQLHPCQTQHLISVITGNLSTVRSPLSDVNKLIAWLSSVARFVHLYLPLEYGKSRETQSASEGHD